MARACVCVHGFYFAFLLPECNFALDLICIFIGKCLCYEIFCVSFVWLRVCVCARATQLTLSVGVCVFLLWTKRCVRMCCTNKWLITIHQIFNTLLQIDINVWWVCGAFIAFYAQSFVMCLCVSAEKVQFYGNSLCFYFVSFFCLFPSDALFALIALIRPIAAYALWPNANKQQHWHTPQME